MIRWSVGLALLAGGLVCVGCGESINPIQNDRAPDALPGPSDPMDSEPEEGLYPLPREDFSLPDERGQ